MKIPQVQGGLGFRVSQNQFIFIFSSEQPLSNFIDTGWEFGGQANRPASEECSRVPRKSRRASTSTRSPRPVSTPR
jgi:hypothetical protein